MGVRPDHKLHELSVSQWTPEEGFQHLGRTFDLACEDFPDVMDPYTVRLADIADRHDIKSFIRAALAETLGQRRRKSKLPPREPT